MVNVRDGGPAFPSTGSESGPDGMSLRDYFAGQALPAMVAIVNKSSSLHPDATPAEVYAKAAEHAYAMADAMIAVRYKAA